MSLSNPLVLFTQTGSPLRALLFLQIIIQAQTQMSKDGPSSNNILSKPEHILSFIKHALQNETMQDAAQKQQSKGPPSLGLTMDDLRIVPEEEQDDVDMESDSDDEAPGPQGVQPNDEMTITALNLLLSILEGASSPRALK